MCRWGHREVGWGRMGMSLQPCGTEKSTFASETTIHIRPDQRKKMITVSLGYGEPEDLGPIPKTRGKMPGMVVYIFNPRASKVH